MSTGFGPGRFSAHWPSGWHRNRSESNVPAWNGGFRQVAQPHEAPNGARTNPIPRSIPGLVWLRDLTIESCFQLPSSGHAQIVDSVQLPPFLYSMTYLLV